MAFNHWRIFSIVEIAVYLAFFLITLIPAFNLIRNPRAQFKWFFLRYYLFVILKVVSGGLLLKFINDSNNGTFNQKILIAALVMNSVSLGFIMTMLIQVVLYLSYHIDPDFSKKKKFSVIQGLRDLHSGSGMKTIEDWDAMFERLTFVAIILVAVGGAISANGSITTTKGLMLAGSVIFLVALIGVVITSFVKLRQHHNLRRTLHKKNYSLILWSALALVPFLFVRIIYAICSVASMKGNAYLNHSRFAFLFGDWKIYVFMAFLEEVVCLLILTIISYIVWFTESQVGTADGPANRFKAESDIDY